jgi:hypothetical protein
MNRNDSFHSLRSSAKVLNMKKPWFRVNFLAFDMDHVKMYIQERNFDNVAWN